MKKIIGFFLKFFAREKEDKIMYRFGKNSLNRIDTLHPDMARVLHRAMSMQIMDFSVLETLRTFERQQRLVRTGASKTLNSKHLKQSDGYSHAFDVAPYPIDWQDTGRFYILNGIIRAAAVIEGVNIRTGADWDSDGLIKDHTFVDLPHCEMVT